jgi:prepilin-type N-terminal cleavage/methylation domain-containing protein
MRKSHRRAPRRHAFTLIEVMIVTVIIGVLLNIAAPGIIRGRERTRARACVTNLRRIDGAKEQWALDTRASSGATGPALTTLVGAAAYIKATPTCPSGGSYTVNSMGTDPACNATGGPYAHAM